jgi:hypothetical protein
LIRIKKKLHALDKNINKKSDMHDKIVITASSRITIDYAFTEVCKSTLTKIKTDSNNFY